MRSSARSYRSPTSSIPSLRAASMKRADCSGSSWAISGRILLLELLAMHEPTGEREVLEVRDYITDHICHGNEHMRNLFTLKGLSVAESYIKGSFWVLVDFECITSCTRSQYIAILHKKINNPTRDLVAFLIGRYGVQLINDYDDLMFVDDVEIVETIENGIPLTVHSSIWLKRLDLPFQPGFYGLYMSQRARPSLRVAPEGEASSASLI